MKKPKITPFEQLEASISEDTKNAIVGTVKYITGNIMVLNGLFRPGERDALLDALKACGSFLAGKGAMKLMTGDTDGMLEILKDTLKRSPLLRRCLSEVEGCMNDGA